METFLTVTHLLVALILIVLVLVQDSKGGSVGGAFGGGGSQSILGATGAATLAQKLTRIVAVLFAITCISLTIHCSTKNKSVMDGAGAAAPLTAPVTPPANTGANAAIPGAPAEQKTNVPSEQKAAAPAESAQPTAPTTNHK